MKTFAYIMAVICFCVSIWLYLGNKTDQSIYYLVLSGILKQASEEDK